MPLGREYDEELKPFVEECIAGYVEDRREEERRQFKTVMKEKDLRAAYGHERRLGGEEKE